MQLQSCLIFSTLLMLACGKGDAPNSKLLLNVQNADTGTVSSTDTGQDQTMRHKAIFVVHLEPGAIPKNSETGTPSTSRAEDYFADLVSLIHAADQFDHKLTIMFTPQWAYYLSQNNCDNAHAGTDGVLRHADTVHETCVEWIHAIQNHGHEVAVHHHPIGSPAGWDGYTSETTWEADRTPESGEETYFADGGGPHGPDPFHLGDVDDLYQTVQSIAGGQDVVSATTEEFPDTIRFSVAGGPSEYVSFNEPGDLLSQPCATNYDGHWVWELRMRLFTSAAAQSTVLNSELPRMLTDLNRESSPPMIIGFVTHAKNINENGIIEYERIFSSLQDNEIQTFNVQHAMSFFDRTTEPPEAHSSRFGCPDSAPNR